LGIHKSATYQQVKRRFVELALEHHPDKVESSKDKHKNKEHFIKFRQAFEALKEGQDGMVFMREKEEHLWTSDEEFNAWFYEETGHSDVMFRMDMKTRKEVIDVVNSQSQGGLDRGGMWEMARKMADQEKMLKDQTIKHIKKLYAEFHWHKIGMLREEHDDLLEKIISLVPVEKEEWDALEFAVHQKKGSPLKIRRKVLESINHAQKQISLYKISQQG
jgi:hypothetical protein